MGNDINSKVLDFAFGLSAEIVTLFPSERKKHLQENEQKELFLVVQKAVSILKPNLHGKKLK